MTFFICSLHVVLQLENSSDEDLVPDPLADLRVLHAQELPLGA